MGTTLSRNYNSLLTHAQDNIYKSGVFQDLYFKQIVTFAKMKDAKRIFVDDGGAKIRVPVNFDTNATTGSFRGYEEFDTTPQDTQSAAFYDRAQYAGTVSISGIEEHIAGGRDGLGDLLQDKIEVTVKSFADLMGQHIMDPTSLGDTSSGNGGRNVMSLPALINYDPDYGTDTVGGINASATTGAGLKWRPQVLDFVTTNTTDALEAKMRKLMNTCWANGGKTDLIITDQTTFENYEAGMSKMIRYTDADSSKASAGFMGIKFKGSEMFWDPYACDPEAKEAWDAPPTAGVAYFIDSDALKLVQAKGKDFAPTPFEWTAKQDARVAAWLWYGQLITTNRRSNGVLYGITKALTISGADAA